jgi:hypothetical protein
MPRHFKVHELLDERSLEELRAFAREPGRTIDDLHHWLLERGYSLSRSAVGNWKLMFDRELMEERMRRSGEFARALVNAAETSDAVAVADAALLQLSQVVFEQSARLQEEGQLDARVVLNWTKALRNLVGSKGGVEELKERQRLAVQEAEKTVKEGGSGEAVVRKMREILGIRDEAAAPPAAP